MTIDFDEENLVIADRLKDHEAEIFILFLRYEMKRHQKDIEKINETIAFLERKHNL